MTLMGFGPKSMSDYLELTFLPDIGASLSCQQIDARLIADFPPDDKGMCPHRISSPPSLAEAVGIEGCIEYCLVEGRVSHVKSLRLAKGLNKMEVPTFISFCPSSGISGLHSASEGEAVSLVPFPFIITGSFDDAWGCSIGTSDHQRCT
jgi:hypothetical protein